MAYNITTSKNEPLVTVSDGSVDNNYTSLNLIGKNFSGYGALLNQNFIYLLENFANDTEPPNPITGQVWYDTSIRKLKVRTPSKEWKLVSSITASDDPLVSPDIGDQWWDKINQQLKSWTGEEWVVVGPLYTAFQGITGAIPDKVRDDVGTDHNVIKFYISDIVVGIWSKEDEPFNLLGPNRVSGFYEGNGPQVVNPGLTLANLGSSDLNNYTDVPKNTIWGTAENAINAQKLLDVDGDKFVRKDLTGGSQIIADPVRLLNDTSLVVSGNIKTTGNETDDIGEPNNRFGTVYAKKINLTEGGIGGTAGVTISENPPASPSNGSLWYDSSSTDARLFVYNDAWIDASPGGPGAIITGPTGPTGPVGVGIATGGLAGQALVKLTNADYDTTWVNLPSGGGGSALTIQNQSVNLTTAATSINFTGGGITATNINNAVTVVVPIGFSGNYNDLTNKPTIPTFPGTNNVQVFLNNGIFTVPAGITKLRIIAVGGGAGGGWYGSAASNYTGGNGGYIDTIVTVTPGSTIPVTIGAGGNGGAQSIYGSVIATNGGTTTFGTLVTATGGQVGALSGLGLTSGTVISKINISGAGSGAYIDDPDLPLGGYNSAPGGGGMCGGGGPSSGTFIAAGGIAFGPGINGFPGSTTSGGGRGGGPLGGVGSQMPGVPQTGSGGGGGGGVIVLW